MIVMSIAGVDPSGGAGIFADIKTFQALGVYGTGIVTALTAQNPQKMYSLKAIETSYVEEQIDAILDTYNVEYIKTGMLYSTDIIKSVSKKIREYNLKAVVDPVMVATSGGELAKNDLSQNLLKYLLPKAILTTPNVSEAEKLTNIKITNEEEAKKACEKLGKTCNNIITGGHLNGINTINIDGSTSIFKQKLLKTDNLHGSGCNFSAAIVSYLSQKNDLKTSILKASDYTYESIKNGKYGTLIAKL
ncbi:MAG: bifunctional hydroxymethylpyrimidine kinase/phosphomethylpyrimidine kinase [Methanobrevibacter smithii]|jgi:hydroxymethylpyrimidine/phosphomethylpyrimidine kinase|uniref:bifunctional hydroxymethylpyrimidine kinase/phosphomethylpyrimidine kinase n=1 Tax=Methanobrevibacter TaxID=2172 RepID=UPI00036E6502|nr:MULTISPECIES: bifunctional hydroxymethylpyrimidine kinase/phosphomethylpyrimidine kinase [Methanobrevibacter]URN49780.1 bifunctional hydroxymethylpyrimidine kinase/phosphomethylpyrimidine kinase [Methanobrevibacter sp. TLL-48-HuF1]